MADMQRQLYLDANAILRYVLMDIEEQYDIVREKIIKEYCVAPLEVITEVDCLLYGYQFARGINVLTFDKKLKNRLG